MKLRLLSRSYCSLCTAMREEVQKRHLDFDEKEIDDFPEYLALYDEKVPVLLGENDEVICYWHFDEVALDHYLSH